MGEFEVRLAVAIAVLAAAFTSSAQAATAGESCQLALAQLLYRPAGEFEVVVDAASDAKVRFSSSFDGSDRTVACRLSGDRLSWRVEDGQVWRRWRDQGADDQLSVSASGFVIVTQEYASLELKQAALELNPLQTTYLTKMLIRDGIDRTAALAVVGIVDEGLQTIGGVPTQAFHCVFHAGELINSRAISYEIMKMDIEECLPGAIRAVGHGAGLSLEQVKMAMLTGVLESRNAIFQLVEVYRHYTASRSNVISDFIRYESDVEVE